MDLPIHPLCHKSNQLRDCDGIDNSSFHLMFQTLHDKKRFSSQNSLRQQTYLQGHRQDDVIPSQPSNCQRVLHWSMCTVDLQSRKGPWWGGIFEQMVKSVKRCLRNSIRRRKLDLDELHTLMIEVEAIVNSTPLSHLSTEDAEEPVTPSHLISGHRLLSLPDGPYHKDLEDDFLEHSVLTKWLIELSKVLDHFWMRWKIEYLLEFRNAHWPKATEGVNRPIDVVEVVIAQDTSSKGILEAWTCRSTDHRNWRQGQRRFHQNSLTRQPIYSPTMTDPTPVPPKGDQCSDSKSSNTTTELWYWVYIRWHNSTPWSSETEESCSSECQCDYQDSDSRWLMSNSNWTWTLFIHLNLIYTSTPQCICQQGGGC